MQDTSVERLLSLLSQLNPEHFPLAIRLAEQMLMARAEAEKTP